MKIVIINGNMEMKILKSLFLGKEGKQIKHCVMISRH